MDYSRAMCIRFGHSFLTPTVGVPRDILVYLTCQEQLLVQYTHVGNVVIEFLHYVMIEFLHHVSLGIKLLFWNLVFINLCHNEVF